MKRACKTGGSHYPTRHGRETNSSYTIPATSSHCKRRVYFGVGGRPPRRARHHQSPALVDTNARKLFGCITTILCSTTGGTQLTETNAATHNLLRHWAYPTKESLGTGQCKCRSYLRTARILSEDRFDVTPGYERHSLLNRDTFLPSRAQKLEKR